MVIIHFTMTVLRNRLIRRVWGPVFRSEVRSAAVAAQILIGSVYIPVTVLLNHAVDEDLILA